MSDFGFKVSIPGKNVKTATDESIVASSSLPSLKCDLRVTPKHYGTIDFTVASITSGSTITIYQIAHGYGYMPSFITAWSYPAGTGGGASANATFGIGEIDCALSSQLLYAMYADATNFTIDVHNYNVATQTSLSGTIRFYIFADDFTTV